MENLWAHEFVNIMAEVVSYVDRFGGWGYAGQDKGRREKKLWSCSGFVNKN